MKPIGRHESDDDGHAELHEKRDDELRNYGYGKLQQECAGQLRQECLDPPTASWALTGKQLQETTAKV